MKRINFTFMLALVVAMLAITASATVAVSYDLEEVTTTAGSAYKVVATLTDDEGDFRGWKNDIVFDYNIIKPVNKTSGAAIDIASSVNNKAALNKYSYYSEEEGDTVASSWVGNGATWTANGAESKLVFETTMTSIGHPSSGVVVFDMTFMIADGYTIDDFTPDTFKVDYIAYPNGNYNYYGAADGSGKTNNIVVTNNVVPAPTVITVPVTAGDIVYLQDGTFATAAETGDYVVLNKEGYVAVNTGKTAQATWYVDGTTATQVHVNGVVGSDELAIRANGLDDVDANNKVRSGLRFKMSHNPTTRKVAEGEKAGVANERDVVTEVGFLMTAMTDKVADALGETPVLTKDHTSGFVKTGKAYSKDDNINIFMTSGDETMIITGVFYGVPLTTTNVQTKIISRPYYIVNGSVIYGEQTESTLYKEARKIYDGEGFDSLEAYAKGYIEEIVGLVDPTIVEEEIIINVGELYTALAALEE